MRWFWLFILGLCVLTGGLYAQRTSAERAAAKQLQSQLEAEREASTPARRPRRDRGSSASSESQPQTPAPTDERDTAVVVEQDLLAEPALDAESQPEVVAEQIDPTESIDEPATGFNPGSILDTMQALKDELPQEQHARKAKPSTEITPAKPAESPEPTGEIVINLPDQKDVDQPDEIAQEEVPAGPSYELRADGSFKVLDANQWVQGAGTEAEPFVLSWEVLKSIDKHYDPKNGKDKLPDWLDLLEGKVVTIEGNTLVPVVASTTRELLIMKNPWDGCCIGVPPTPYDAVEIALDHDVDFGNSAVGYGSVVGTFYADPYVVDGWVLGVYIIEEAQYRSGEGVVFPEF